MSILVSDTSVVIDLDRAQLIDELFLLPFEFAVPDLLFERELDNELGERLIRLGLRIEALSSEEVSEATNVARQQAQLSLPDTFAFTIAKSRGWGLLTGDGPLRRLAVAENVEMHGVLWVLDQLSIGGHVPGIRLHTGLRTLYGHPRCRLPREEVEQRLILYSEPR